MGVWQRFAGLDPHINRIASWAGIVGLVWAGMTWVASQAAPLAGFGWAVYVFIGFAVACVLSLVLSFALVAWRYFRPLPTPSMAEQTTPRLETLLVAPTNSANDEKSGFAQRWAYVSARSQALDDLMSIVEKAANGGSHYNEIVAGLRRETTGNPGGAPHAEKTYNYNAITAMSAYQAMFGETVDLLSDDRFVRNQNKKVPTETAEMSDEARIKARQWHARHENLKAKTQRMMQRISDARRDLTIEVARLKKEATVYLRSSSEN